MIRKGASFSPTDSGSSANLGGRSGQLFRVVLLDGTDIVLDINVSCIDINVQILTETPN